MHASRSLEVAVTTGNSWYGAKATRQSQRRRRERKLCCAGVTVNSAPPSASSLWRVSASHNTRDPTAVLQKHSEAINRISGLQTGAESLLRHPIMQVAAKTVSDPCYWSTILSRPANCNHFVQTYGYHAPRGILGRWRELPWWFS